MKRNVIFIFFTFVILIFSGCAPKETPEIVKAASYGDIETVESLIAAGADVNAESGSVPWNALVGASKRGDVEIMQELIKAGANVNPSTLSGLLESPLIAATQNSKLEAVKLLVNSGANLNTQKILWDYERYGTGKNEFSAKIETSQSPLMIASKYDDLEIVNVLLDAGVDVNLRGRKRGDTALSLAVDYGHIDIVKALVEKGADINQRYRKTKLSILEQSIKTGRTEIAEILIDSGAK